MPGQKSLFAVPGSCLKGPLAVRPIQHGQRGAGGFLGALIVLPRADMVGENIPKPGYGSSFEYIVA